MKNFLPTVIFFGGMIAGISIADGLSPYLTVSASVVAGLCAATVRRMLQ